MFYTLLDLDLENHSGKCNQLIVFPPTQLRSLLIWFLQFQWNSDWPETQVCQIVASTATTESNQQNSQAESCLRLCHHFVKECFQYSDCLHPLSIHFCCDRCPIVQWKVLLLHRWEQTRCGGVSVSIIVLSLYYYHSLLTCASQPW